MSVPEKPQCRKSGFHKRPPAIYFTSTGAERRPSLEESGRRLDKSALVRRKISSPSSSRPRTANSGPERSSGIIFGEVHGLVSTIMCRSPRRVSVVVATRILKPAEPGVPCLSQRSIVGTEKVSATSFP